MRRLASGRGGSLSLGVWQFSHSTPRVFLFAAFLALAVFLVPHSLLAQTASTGTVEGVVTDPSAAAVVGASVTLTDAGTGASRSATTNDSGRYFFANVVPGKYTVAINKSGFRVLKFTDQIVNVSTNVTLNAALELGPATETVEVTATGVDLQTLNATVGNTVSGDALQNMPSINRDVTTFVTLQPGVSPDGSVAGAVVDQSSFMLDGGQNTNDMDGSMQVYTPSFAGDPSGGVVSNAIGGSPTGVMPTPIDSVEEFKVNTANQTADFNSSAGAQVQIITKRGTNSWHGSAYEYYLDNGLNANTFDNNATGTPLPSYHYNRFGASGGGPIINKEFLGGKTYFFANYEGFRWNNSSTFEMAVPSENMRNGILTFNGANYNLATGNNCGPGGGAACDPRGIGINPLVQQMWNTYEPVGNDPSCGALIGSKCDGVNEIGYKANVSVPQTSNFGVARLDHDFGSKWHFNSSYRYYKVVIATTSQVDIGGFFPGDTLGTPAALSTRPQQPWYYVAGLTTNITSHTTNDFHFSYLRNYWSWSNPGGVTQFSQLGGALEPFGESATSVLAPYNVNTQSVRTRFWDGHDYFLRDDVTMLKGNHLLTFGGAYQRNWDWHQRSDNGGGINYQPTYQLGDSSGGGLVDFSSTLPAGVSASTWARDSAAVLGVVTDSQIAYTRSGPNLNLNPPLTHAFDQSTIPYYNVYFSDSWHMKPSFTLTYGLGWTLEMPPTEAQGKQIELVDSSGQQLDTMAYIKQREAAALQGQVYNPTVGFALVGNTGSGQKYPYDPYYGSFSPRIAAAWNPNVTDGFMGELFGGNKTVVRGGYSRVYGRLNGVDLVLVPLLGTGLIQAVQCRQNFMPVGGNAPLCGPNNPTVANAFRVGVDGNNAPIPAATATLPQPTFPGINSVAAGAGEALDPHFRPNVVDSFDFTIQRQLSNKFLLELGYIGRRITHEYQPININAVPYMMTLGGQSFAKAYAAIETAMGCATSFAACGAATPGTTVVTPQPFFEAAMNPAYCAGFSSCTAAVLANEFSNFQSQSVWTLWSDLDNGGFSFPRSMLNTPIPGSAPCPGAAPTDPPCGVQGQMTSGVGVNASVGHGNYNGAFVTLKMNNWHGITLQENFTWSKALGTGALVQATSEYTVNDPFNLNNGYGLQNFDRKFVFNTYALIEEPWFKHQQGFVGRVLGGWSISPILAIGSGQPLGCGTNQGDESAGQGFGSGDSANFFTNENCILTKAASGGSASLHRTADTAATGQFNIFADPDGLLATLRPAILGLDNNSGGLGVFRGLPYWNVDLRVVKDIHITERTNLQFQYVVTNLFNHPVFADPTSGQPETGLGVDPTVGPGSSFGVVNTQGNNPRRMQFGLRFTF
ncbi:MAG TPA: carboxypeptidase-like regulatory domain-containing protein [Candidatus Acidoferrum sp.]|nr:carboxypeptidase-like regulatory domain-containing protein [Candidatus Acidoferrum sp.]